jgi:hypothetical protein
MNFIARLGPAPIRPWLVACCAIVITLGFVASDNAACLLPPAGLVSWWPGEGNAEDQMGANPGVVMNGVTFVPGMVGLAFSFDGSLVFVSDGESDREGLLYPNDVAGLNQAGVYLRAFGVGSNSLEFLPNLQLIDPNAQIFTTSDQLVEFFGGPTGSLFEPEPGLAGVTLYLDLNNNGRYDDGEPNMISAPDDPATPNEDETGQYCFGQLTASPVVVRQVPLADFASTFGGEGQGIADVHRPFLTGVDYGLARRAHLGPDPRIREF